MKIKRLKSDRTLSKDRIIQIKDRKLGDEWIGWQGHLKDFEKNSNAGKRIFLGILLLTIFMTGIIGCFLLYMIVPRLVQFHPSLPFIIGFLLLFFWFFLALWFFLIVLSIMTKKDFFIRLGRREFSITFLVPIVIRFGLRMGISKDRLGNSFVKVSNSIILTKVKKVKPEKLLILLPRCLQKSLRNKITSFSKQCRILVFTVPGGEMARKLVYEHRPKAIIGVACERDLMSGIRDVVDRIPVIGIPNIRPNGPCKNTLIDIRELEKTIKMFINTDFCITQPENIS